MISNLILYCLYRPPVLLAAGTYLVCVGTIVLYFDRIVNKIGLRIWNGEIRVAVEDIKKPYKTFLQHKSTNKVH